MPLKPSVIEVKKNSIVALFAFIVLILGLSLFDLSLLDMVIFVVLLALMYIPFTSHRQALYSRIASLRDLPSGKKILAIAILLVFAVVLFFSRPWLHEIFMFVFTNTFLYPLALLLVLWVALPLITGIPQKGSSNAGLRVLTIVSAIAVISIIISIFFGQALLYNSIASSTNYEPVSKLPDSSNYRLLPFEVAQAYFSNTLADPTQQPGNMDLSIVDGNIAWVVPKIPNGFFLYYFDKPKGIMIADATTSDKKISVKDQTFEVGEGIGLFDNIEWVVYSKDFLIQKPDVFYVPDRKSGEIFLIVPIVHYEFSFPVMKPYFDGALVFDKAGNSKRYSAAELQSLELLKNAPVFPESLARLNVDSFQFKKGILNAWFYHEDQIRIPEMPSANQQPFLLQTVEGLKWVVAAEPIGEENQNFGILKIFLVDAVSGKIQVYNIGLNKTLIGPSASLNYAKKDNPLIDWSNFEAIEPRPYFSKEDLYWLASIVLQDYSGVSYTVAVNSRTAEVNFFKKDSEVLGFFKGVLPQQRPIDNSTQSSGGGKVQEKISQIEGMIEQLQKQLQELKSLTSTNTN